MQHRLTRLYQALENAACDGYVALARPNQHYLIDSPQPVSDLPPVTAILFTAAGASQETLIFPGAPFYYACRDHLPDYALAPTEVGSAPVFEQLATTIQQMGLHRVVIDPPPAGVEQTLRNELTHTELWVAPTWGPMLRRTKDKQEIELMRGAARISDLGMEAAFKAARPGVSGRDIAAASAAAMLEAGAEDASLQVAVGPATAYMGTGDWVYDPRRTLQDGDMLLVDMAIRYHGYLGDQTRTAIVGEGSAQQRELIDTVQEAYRATVAEMRPGASSEHLYAITVDLLEQKGWRQYFPHHISHGLGLGGDLPRVAQDSNNVLQVGDAFSCEPGVYIPGLGGARFENMLLLTETGIEELTQSPADPATA